MKANFSVDEKDKYHSRQLCITFTIGQNGTFVHLVQNAEMDFGTHWFSNQMTTSAAFYK